MEALVTGPPHKLRNCTACCAPRHAVHTQPHALEAGGEGKQARLHEGP